MAVYRDNIIDIDLGKGPIERSFTNFTIGEGDLNGNRIGMRVKRDGIPVSLENSIVTGFFVRQDGTTVIIAGSISGNEAFVVLPESCYTIAGNFTLAIKVTAGGNTGTMRIVDGTVVNTTTDAVYDTGGIVPDIEELMTVIDQAEAAAADIAKFSVTEQLISGDDYRMIIDIAT